MIKLVRVNIPLVGLHIENDLEVFHGSFRQTSDDAMDVTVFYDLTNVDLGVLAFFRMLLQDFFRHRKPIHSMNVVRNDKTRNQN